MLDDKCECVLKKILAFSRGEYTVLDSSDFSEVENADEVISKLEECGYIALGYSDDSEYLLKPTAAGKNYFAGKNDMLLTQGVFLRKTAVYALIGGLSYKFKQRSEHDVSLFSPSGVHIELHYTLTGDEVNEKSSAVLNNVWNYVLSASSYEKKLTNELFYFYHIAHMAKHFALGGCGVRPFIDLKIMNDKFVLNRKQLDEMLNEGGLKKFEEAAVKLSRLWFENGENKESFGEEIYVMSDYILYSGVYGSAENRVMVSQKKKGGKFGYAMSRIFLPYSVMKKMHPVLEKHKWLLPWFEVRRWFVILFDGRAKSAMQELKYNEIADLHAGEKYRDMMNKLEL